MATSVAHFGQTLNAHRFDNSDTSRLTPAETWLLNVHYMTTPDGRAFRASHPWSTTPTELARIVVIFATTPGVQPINPHGPVGYNTDSLTAKFLYVINSNWRAYAPEWTRLIAQRCSEDYPFGNQHSSYLFDEISDALDAYTTFELVNDAKKMEVTYNIVRGIRQNNLLSTSYGDMHSGWQTLQLNNPFVLLPQEMARLVYTDWLHLPISARLTKHLRYYIESDYIAWAPRWAILLIQNDNSNEGPKRSNKTNNKAFRLLKIWDEIFDEHSAPLGIDRNEAVETICQLWTALTPNSVFHRFLRDLRPTPSTG